MAEQPRIFTLPPWGYRIATPALVHLVPAASTSGAFRGVTFAALVAAGGLLFVFLRRLGFRTWAALTAVALYGISEPFVLSATTIFLVDPETLVLELLLLLALE